MSAIRRAFLYLVRKKMRSILLFLMLFIACSFLIMGLSVKTSVDTAEDDLRRTLACSFNLKADTENESLYEPETDQYGLYYLKYAGPLVTEEIREAVLNIEGVEAWAQNGSSLCVYTNLTFIPGSWMNDYIGMTERGEKEQPYCRIEDAWIFAKSPLIFGVNDSSRQEYFRSGAFILTQGRHLRENDANCAVISERLAEMNGLSLGDRFTVEVKEGNQYFSEDPMRTTGEPVELELVGLFDVVFTQEIVSDFTAESEIAENMIFSDMESYRSLYLYKTGRKPDRSKYADLTFFVDDPGHLETVISKVREIDGIKDLILEMDDTAYQASAVPLRQMGGFAAFLIVFSILSVLILLWLVLHMWMKERRREIGILLSAGIRKNSIRIQFILEGLFISAAAFVLSVVISGAASDGFGTLSETLTAPKNDGQTYTVASRYGSMEPEIRKLASEPVRLDYPVTVRNLLLSGGLVCGMVVISMLAASAQTLRMKPKEILLN